VAVGIDYVDELLTPFGITRHRVWLVSCCEREVVNHVNIGNVED
jgi:hypothetical protein